jgi:SPP1 family predicted phage head-tail adaptor
VSTRIGALRHRIDIQQAVETRTASGAISKSWTNVYSGVRAAIEPLSGEEPFNSQEFSTQTFHRVTIRSIPGVTQKMRVVFGTRTMDILELLDTLEEKRWMVMKCLEGRSKGN